MAITIDARTLSCPQPVVLTNKALEEADEVETIVDNEAARENVSRLARSRGFEVEVEERDGAFHLKLHRQSAKPGGEPGSCEAVVNELVGRPGPVVLLIGSDSVGRGSDELGRKLSTAFVQILSEVTPRPQTIIFMNSGVKLVCTGSQVLEDLGALEEEGVSLLACGTCLGHYELANQLRVGTVSNMFDIATAMMGAAKVVAP